MANLTFKSTGSTIVTLSSTGANAPVGLQYSKNNGTWSDYTIGTAVSLGNNQTVAFSGSAKFSTNMNSKYFFTTSGEGTLALSGDLMSLVSSSTIEDAYQFNSLFQCCQNIVDASNLTLNATNTKQFCYANLFLDCINLTTPPILSATELDQWCYSSMFGNCSSLTAAPALVATTLAKYCYYCMFYGCKSLVEAPYLPASSLTDWCYNSMFYNCTALTNIKCDFESWTPSNATTNWVTGIDTIGEFENDNVTEIYGDNNIPPSWDIDWVTEPLTFIARGNSTNAVGLTDKQTWETVPANTLSYSKNDGEWQPYSLETIIELQNGQTVAFSGNNNNYIPGICFNFIMTGAIEANGNEFSKFCIQF